MADVLRALILSGHMTREHDNEFRCFRQHNQWLTTLLEDTGRFCVRVVEDPRGLGAEVIDRYDVVIVVFEGRDGYHQRAVGFGPETDEGPHGHCRIEVVGCEGCGAHRRSRGGGQRRAPSKPFDTDATAAP